MDHPRQGRLLAALTHPRSYGRISGLSLPGRGLDAKCCETTTGDRNPSASRKPVVIGESDISPAQSLGRDFPYKEEVGGSSPSTPTINFHSGYRARLAPSRRRQIARPRFGPHLVRVRIDHSLVEVARGSHDRHLHRLSTTGHGHLNIRSDEVNPSAWSKKSATNLGRVTVEMKAPISRGPLSSFPPPLKPRSTELYVTSLTLELKRSLLEMLPPTARSLGVGCIWQASQQKAPTQERDQWRD